MSQTSEQAFATQPDQAAELRTVVIEWTEVSTHRVTVNVPVDFDPEGAEMADALADLTDDGFIGVEREDIAVQPLDVFDATAETFDPS